jgi:hypothetical protein
MIGIPYPLAVLQLLIVLGIIAGNTFLTLRISRDELSAPTQRLAQLLLIWLLPIMGRVFVYFLTRDSLGKSPETYPKERQEPDEDPAVAQADYSQD